MTHHNQASAIAPYDQRVDLHPAPQPAGAITPAQFVGSLDALRQTIEANSALMHQQAARTAAPLARVPQAQLTPAPVQAPQYGQYAPSFQPTVSPTVNCSPVIHVDVAALAKQQGDGGDGGRFIFGFIGLFFLFCLALTLGGGK